MDHIQRLAKRASVNYKRYVRFRSPLRTCYNVDAVTSQRSEQFPCNPWRMLHVFAYDSHCGQSAFSFHRRNLSHFNLFRKFFIQDFTRQRRIFIPDTDRSGVLRGCLGNKKHTDSILCQCLEYTVIHTDNANHSQSGHRNQTRVVD